jgi:hypothetical protein
MSNGLVMRAADLRSLLLRGKDVGLENVHIYDDLDISHSQIQGRLSFLGCTWHGKVVSAYAVFQKLVTFHLCAFNQDVSFEFARFGSTVEFRGTEFHKNARFNRMKVGGVTLFRPHESKDCKKEFREGQAPKRTVFHGEALFLQADFGREANFGSVLFKGYADFYNVEVHGPAFYRPDQFKVSELEGPPVSFLQNVRFRVATFEGELNCYGVQCRGQSDFSLMRVAGPAFFSEPERYDAVTYWSAEEVQNLVPWRPIDKQALKRIPAKFSLSVDFSAATFESIARFNGTLVGGPLSMVGTNFKRELALKGVTLASGKVKLRGCTYGRIELRKDALQSFVNSVEDREKPQIWVQLESVLRSMGEEEGADTAYIKRRDEAHRRLKDQLKAAKGVDRFWRFGPLFWDGVVKRIGYGTDTKVIFIVPIAIWAATFFLLAWAPVPVTYSLKDSTLECQPQAGGNYACTVSDEVSRDSWRLGDALGVTLSHISPVPLGVGSKFELNGNRALLCWEGQDHERGNGWCKYGPTYAGYGAFLRLLSWITIPLWLARWTGLLNQRVRAKYSMGGEGE